MKKPFIISLVCIFILGGVSIAAILMRDNQGQLDDTVLTNTNNSEFPSVLNGRCDVSECLVNILGDNLPHGVTEVRGYYYPVEREAFWNKELCNGFVVTGASSQVLQGLFTTFGTDGSVDGNPVIDLDFTEVSETEEQQIRSSRNGSEISLRILLPVHEATEAPVCWSIANIIEVLP